MSEQNTPTPQATDDSALTEENLDSVAGGVNIAPFVGPTVCPPPFGPVGPVTDPILIDGTTLV
ncbi:MAG TPA: hypothetical protein VEX86_22645 [Longimicrobium sp.]|nr:hypothetical protein [Longimicrobium sp.]